MRRLNYLEKLILYGLIGWAIEIFFTGIASALDGDITLKGETYIWMFPVWISGVYALEYSNNFIGRYNFLVRGLVYTLVCFSIEFVWGMFFNVVLGIIPWNYSTASDWNVLGAIRLDYFPFWFIVGLMSEPVINWVRRLRLHITNGEEK